MGNRAGRTPLRFPYEYTWQPPPPDWLRTGQRLYRVQRRGHWTALHYGRDPEANNRWNPPLHATPQFGVWYAALAPAAAITETLLANLHAGVVSLQALQSREMLEATLAQDVKVIDLGGAALAAIQADARLLSTDQLGYPRAWAHALHTRCTVNGLLYPTRTYPGIRALALFESAGRNVLQRNAKRTPLIGWHDPDDAHRRNLIDWLEQKFNVSVKDDRV